MFWKKKRQQKNDYSKILGLQNTGEIQFSSPGQILLPISRAILCFLLTIGSICGFASCFGAQFNLNVILIVLFICSVIIAFVRNLNSKFLKNLCYIGFLFLFVFLILRFYRYVNSGYHAIVNITYASLENYLGIPALVHYEEIIENSYVTITLFLIFLGVFELLLYHMWVGERINLMTIFLVSFGPQVVPLFINMIPETFYLACLMTAYITIIILRFGLHINTHPEKHKSYSVYHKFNPWSARFKGFSYGANGISYFMSLFVSFLLSLSILLMVNVTVPYASFQNNLTTSPLKQSIMDEVKYLVTFGLSGYFNRYSSTGGLNDGKLGGVYSVRPDYETDLTVRYVPLSSQPVYLRGFVGIGYTDRQWYNLDSLFHHVLITDDIYNELHEDTALIDEYNNLSGQNILSSPYRMDITNIDASVGYYYAPYYTDPVLLKDDPSLINSQYKFFLNETKTYTYYPYINNAKNSLSSLDDSAILPTYLQVPTDTREEILEFLNEKELCTEYITKESGANNHLSGSELQTVVNRISNCLSSDFVYSMNPGITPKNEDYVGYFLNNTNKGFCAHFATSSVLIFRTLGIPARYAEGYVVTAEDLYTARIVEDADISSYINTSFVDMNLSVVDVDIADDKAHAWVEYYDPDFGWKVFEATTASMDSSANLDFWSSIYRMFNQAVASGDDTAIIGENGISVNSLTTIIARILLVTAVLTLLVVILFFSYRSIRQYRSYHRVRRNINVRNYYKIICRHIIKRYPDFDYIVTFTEQLEFISNHYRLHKIIKNTSLDKLSQLLEQAAFSNNEMTYSEYQYSMGLLKLIRRNIILHF